MARRVHISIPKETWAYLIILCVVIVGAILREINLLIILSGLMFGPIWISWYLVRSTLKRLSVRRKLPQAVFPGELLMVDVEIKNEKRRLDSWGIIYEDHIRHVNKKREVPSKSIRALIPHIPSGESRETSFRCRLWERGRYRLGPARVATQMPLGLLRGDSTHRSADEILVYPQTGHLTGKWNEMVNVDRPGPRSWHRHQGQIEGDFYGLRDWRSGDCRRWIHWRSSAKRNELVVRQFEQMRTHDFVILLDLWLEKGGNFEDIEKAISFAATVAAEHCRRGTGHIMLGIAADPVRVIRGAATSALLGEALETLGDAQASANDALSELVQETLRFFNRDDQIVLVSTRDTSLVDPNRLNPSLLSEERRTSLARTVCVNVNAPTFSDLFTLGEVEEMPTAH